MISQANKPTRGQALQEAFFYKMDQELIALLSRRLQREEKLKSFAQATGIKDEKRLEMLVDAGFEMPTLTAFIWVPVVFVAWADGEIDDKEKASILEILTRKGVSQQNATMMLEHEWFRHSPSEDLWKIWEEFIATTLVSLAPSVRGQLSDEIVELCHVVAQSSGGFLGIGKVSWSETRAIERVIESLQRYSATEHSANEAAV